MSDFPPLRRAKQALSQDECAELLARQKRGVLSVISPTGYPYALPLNHYFLDGKLYFHCATDGHKIRAIAACEKACFCTFDAGEKIPDHWALRVKSVVVFGRVKLIENTAQKERICRALAHKFTDDEAYIDDEIRRGLGRVACIELTPEFISGKWVKES